MSKSIQNLGTEIGKLFFGNNGGSSAAKTENSKGFSDCLSKLASRDNKPTAQKEKNDNIDVVGNKSDDCDNIEKSDNKPQMSSDNKKAENTDISNQEKDVLSVDDNKTEEIELNDNIQINFNEVPNVSAFDLVATSVDISVSDIPTEEIGVEPAETTVLVGEVAQDVQNLHISEEGAVSDFDFSRIVSENKTDKALNVNTVVTNAVDFLQSDSQYAKNDTSLDFSVVAESEGILVDAKTETVFAGNKLKSENVMLGDDLSEDIASVKISDNTLGVAKNEIEISTEPQNVQDVALDKDTEINSAENVGNAKKIAVNTKISDKVENDVKVEEIPKTPAEVKTEGISEINSSAQTENEAEDMNLGNFENSFNAETVSDKKETKLDSAVYDKVDFRTEVNLSNHATRGADAAEAVQTTIFRNTADMVGKMETKTMELMLTPENLGKIVIKMQSTSEGLNIKIIADNLDVNKGLEMRIFQIENTLKEQGVTLNNIEIEHSSVSDNTASGFMDMNNFERGFNEGFAQNQTSERRSRDEYIEYTEYAYDGIENADIENVDADIRIMGNYNVEFLA